jgi:hypothetical protein
VGKDSIRDHDSGRGTFSFLPVLFPPSCTIMLNLFSCTTTVTFPQNSEVGKDSIRDHDSGRGTFSFAKAMSLFHLTDYKQFYDINTRMR